MEARIFMKFENYVHKIVLDHQPNFHKDPFKEAKTLALAMPFKNSDTGQQKPRKYVFRPFINRHQKKLFYSLFSIRPKYYESSKTEYSDSISCINRLTPLIFSLGFWNFFRGAKRGVPQKNFVFFFLLSHDNRPTWIYSPFTASYGDCSFQNCVPPPLNRVKLLLTIVHT